MTHSPRIRAARSPSDQTDAEKLGKLISSVARDASAATLEFKAAKKLMLRDLCLLFGAGSYERGREALLQLLTEGEGQ